MHNPINPGDILGGMGLPQAREAEMALLGSMIFDNDTIQETAETVMPEDFAYPAHQAIYRTILELADSLPRGSIDLVVLRDKLDDKRMLESVGGADYLMALVEGVPNAANAPRYAKTVREKATLRQVIEACSRTVHDATIMPYDGIADIISAAYTRIKGCLDRLGDNTIQPVGDHLHEVFHDIQERFDGKKPLALPTGITTLDTKLGGLRAGYYVVAARAKMGKTSLVMNILEHLAINKKIPAALITLESNPKDITELLLSSRARVDSTKIALGTLNEEEYQKTIMIASELHDAPLYIHSARTPAEVEGLIRRLYVQKGIKFAATDYLQRAVRDMDRENEEIARFSNSLCNLAQQELKIPIVAIAQVVKEVDKREDPHPRIGDIYGPSSVGHDADAVLLLYRDDYYKPNSLTKGIADIDIVQRKGENCRIQLKWEGEYRRFSDLEKKA